MNNEQRQAIEAFVNDAQSCRDASDWGAAKLSFLKALEEFDRLEREEDAVITEGDIEYRKKLQAEMSEIDNRLAVNHRETGQSAMKAKDYGLAIDEFEEAIELAAEINLPFLEEVKKELDRARTKDRDARIFKDITPCVTRGDEFFREGNFGEAILEYQEALTQCAGLPPEHRFVTYIHEAIREARRQLVRPYLNRAGRALDAGRSRLAYKILQRAQLLIADDDPLYKAFAKGIEERVAKTLTKEDLEEAVEESDPNENWADAVKDYEEALSLYSSYTVNDPLAPAYQENNIYSDRFLSSRRKLAALYFKRAEKLKERVELKKAIRNFKEALKLFPRSDKEFHTTFRMIKQLRAQLLERTV